MSYIEIVRNRIKRIFDNLRIFKPKKICFGKVAADAPEGTLIIFPIQNTVLACGLAGIVALKKHTSKKIPFNTDQLSDSVSEIETYSMAFCRQNSIPLTKQYLGGLTFLRNFFNEIQLLKRLPVFFQIYADASLQTSLTELTTRIKKVIDDETHFMSAHRDTIGTLQWDLIAQSLEALKDIHWCLKTEIVQNIHKIADISQAPGRSLRLPVMEIYKNINAVLNSIDRLEVRGRDSAGISLMFVLDCQEYQKLQTTLTQADLLEDFTARTQQNILVNLSIRVAQIDCNNQSAPVALTFTYKIAAEIGSLGDNIAFLRNQIKHDRILHILIKCQHRYHTVSSHTRWASVGAINEPNCHPVDNLTSPECSAAGTIHACLNGDIDNYLQLKQNLEKHGSQIPEDITTDTKIIPLQVEHYIQKGHAVEEAFRLAVNDFTGSHAISMHTDLAPGKLFLAQKGSGQAIFIGLAEDHYMPTSEVYGFVEETDDYLKLDGEKISDGKNGPTQGQIFVLNQDSNGGIEGLQAFFYDGTPIVLNETDIKHTKITSRDIDRQGYPHYFLKEISESPISVEKTLQNRCGITDDQYTVSLGEKIVPSKLKKAIIENQIRRIYFVGQGTAGVAAQACADILSYYLNDPRTQISALKASELSGFKLGTDDQPSAMSDTLVVAISQSGTTTDTNRTVDMVRERNAYTLAIVNRRDSDITFKVDGVLYTSSGRDIEMSVASTKAFYSQIVAGAILGLYLAELKKRRNQQFIANEIKQLLDLPSHMRAVLAMQPQIEKSARKHAVTKTYWAAVGSGPNKASADEIRIKLSELCYKTISTDYVEDKKHIDLSSEPLIIVCAAGTGGSVIGDIVKDTAIFRAHKATPIVIADQGEERFAPYAADVFHVPVVSQHLAPILNTLIGHIWGYYAALAINEGSRFLFVFREKIRKCVDEFAAQDLDVYETILEKTFREKVAHFYSEFRRQKAQNLFPSIMGFKASADLTLLLKYLLGRLPISDFEIDFNIKGTALNMLNTFFEIVGESINQLARPVDAIKHQAKTVTVGTSRIREKVEGLLFDILTEYGFGIGQLTNNNVIVLKNLQGILSSVKGSILYRISGLDMLGELTDATSITVVQKTGLLADIPSRVEEDNALKGTKRIIVRQGNVYIGKGRKDDRSILVVPIISSSPSIPNMIENLLLLNIAFKEDVSLPTKIKALGGKYEHIQNIVQENNILWRDEYIEQIAMEELFGRSAEKISEFIINQQVNANAN